MIYDDSHCDTYEEYCEEILAYMRCQNESFDFGEGLIGMTDGGEYGMYKIAILPYLNSFYKGDEIDTWWSARLKDILNKRIEAKFDDLSNENLHQKLHNSYDINMKHRKRQYNVVKRTMTKRIYPPYYIDEDECGLEYVKSVNRPSRSKDMKRKYKRKKQVTRSYIHYCEYCERNIIYDDETLCDNCYLNFEEGILVYNYWKENWIWANNDFSDNQVKDGHWCFHNYYDEEEARWNILHMKLN